LIRRVTTPDPHDAAPHCAIEQLTAADGTARVLVRGELDLAAVPRLRQVLADLRHDGRSTIIDVTDVRFMDSSGLRVLVEAGAQRKEGWGVMLALPSTGPVHRLVDLTGVGPALPPAP
jgi:anti-anti-sigma factor